MDIFKKIKTFFSEVKSELKKVNWPTKKDTIRDTFTVIGVSVVLAAFLGGVDFLITFLLREFVM